MLTQRYRALDLSTLPDDAQLAARLRGLAESDGPLPPPAQWPSALRIAASFCLSSPLPAQLWWGPELVLIYNDACIPLLGRDRHAAAFGRPAREVWAEIWPQIGPSVEQVLSKRQGCSVDAVALFAARAVAHQELHTRWSFSPLFDDTGALAGLCANVSDLTETQLAQRRLETLHALATCAGPDATTAEICEAAAELLSQRPLDLAFAALYVADIGHVGERDSSDVTLCARCGLAGAAALPPRVAPGDPDSPPWLLAAALRSGQAVQLNGLAERALPGGAWPEPADDAMVLPLAGAGLLLLGASPRQPFDAAYREFFERLAALIGTRLATAQAYAREHRRAQTLAELDRAKTAFFSNVSHEFRTPLTLMLAPLEDMLASLPAGDAALGATLQMVHRNAQRLQRLVGALLDHSRIDAGRAQASFEPTDLSVVTADLASVFRAAVERGGLAFHVQCEPLGEPVWIDREMWEKVVLNLLSNAFKFTFRGAIDVVLLRAGERAALVVRDSGIGVAPDQLPHLFERFHRVEGARSRTQEGTGIGLSLVQEFVRAHSGTIDVRSQPGVGTAFTVTLPFGCAHLPPEHVHEARTTPASLSSAAALVQETLRWIEPNGRARLNEANGHGRAADAQPASVPGAVRNTDGARILVADDNADMRDYLARLLGEHWQVDTVADGEAALALARARPYDLVMSDVMMPKVDGLQLLQALRHDPALATLPVIMLSARAGEEARVEGMQLGADDYLVKPFSAREVVARVEAQLRLSALRLWVNESLRTEVAERRAAEDRVRDLLHRLVDAQEDERRRIARELHDTLGQHLSAVTLGLRALRAHPDCTAMVVERLDRVHAAALQLDDAMDRLAYELRPAVLDDLGLADALRSHALDWTRHSGVPVEVHTRGIAQPRVPADIELTAYRVVQEALTNIHKHAQASRVGLIAERRSGDLRVIVEDDGCGFDAAEEAATAQARRSFGLRGMSERAGLVGGRLQIESAPGEGTTVYLTIPLA